MNNIRYSDYEEFIYLNTLLSPEKARLIATECWNRGLDKHEALNEARKLYENTTK